MQPTPWPAVTSEHSESNLWADGGVAGAYDEDSELMEVEIGVDSALVIGAESESDKATDEDSVEPEDTVTTINDEHTGGTEIYADTASETWDTGWTEDTDVESDTEFECADDMGCNIKWSGTICCDNRCVNPLKDAEHCGACQNDCVNGDHCLMGECKAYEWTDEETEDTDTCEPCERKMGDLIDNDCDGWIDEEETDSNC
jgi:hypothetical protein